MRIRREECAGLLIDIQERLFPHMDQKEELLRKTLMLLKGLNILNVPLLFTEQYPKGLGPTLKAIRETLGAPPALEKSAFSCCDEPGYVKAMEELGRKTLIICGIEAHVCVMQTCIDLRASGYAPVLVEDCVSSRNPEDKRVAIHRMSSEGVLIATCESILFELTRNSGTEEFKAISSLVK